MKKSIAKNYLYNLTYQILVIIIPLILAPYLARILGPENLGIYGYTLSISAYFVLFGTLGLTMYGKREIAYVQDDKKQVSKKFYEIVIIKVIFMIISMIAFYIFFANSNSDYSLYYKILLIELFASMIDISWFFEGLELFKKTILRNIIIKLITVISIFAFVRTNQHLNIYIIIYAVSILLGNLSLWVSLPKYINRINLKEINLVKHIKPTIALFIPQIAIQLYTVVDRTMIGLMMPNKAEVGFYDQSQKLIAVLLTIVTALGSVMLPRVSNDFAKGNYDSIKNYLNKSFRFVYLLALPFIFGIIAVSKYFIPLYLGENYTPVVTLISILSLIILFIGMSNVIGIQYLLPTKKQKQFTISVFSGAIVNLIFNLILIPIMGTVGACVATILAEASVLLTQMYFVKDTFRIWDVIKNIKNYILASGIMYLVIEIINKFIISDVKHIYICAIDALIGIIVYGGILLVLKDKLVIYIIEKVFKRKK